MDFLSPGAGHFSACLNRFQILRIPVCSPETRVIVVLFCGTCHTETQRGSTRSRQERHDREFSISFRRHTNLTNDNRTGFRARRSFAALTHDCPSERGSGQIGRRAAACNGALALVALSMTAKAANSPSACLRLPEGLAAWDAMTEGEGLLRLFDHLDADACGSRSNRADFKPRCSASTAGWMATVVLRAPPFWLIVAIVFLVVR
jgi:hypothetical protein